MHNREVRKNAVGIFQTPSLESGMKCFYAATPAHPCQVSPERARELYEHNCQIIYARDESGAKAQLARHTPYLDFRGQPILGLHHRTADKNAAIRLPETSSGTRMTPTPIPKDSLTRADREAAAGKDSQSGAKDRKRKGLALRRARNKAVKAGILKKNPPPDAPPPSSPSSPPSSPMPPAV